jgi:hypothetical protein
MADSMGSTLSIRDIFQDRAWGIHPTHISLSTLGPGTVRLQDLFFRLSKMKTLSLNTGSLSALHALIPDSARGGGVLCPDLIQVECLFLPGFPNLEFSGVDSLLLTVQEAREKKGFPRPKFDIRWREQTLSR